MTTAAMEDMNCHELDGEGRIMRTEHGKLVIFNVYFPNAGRVSICHL